MRLGILIGLVAALLAGCWVASGQVFVGRPLMPLSTPDTGTIVFAENFEGANIPVPNNYDLTGWTAAGAASAGWLSQTTFPACGTASLQIRGGNSEGQFSYSNHTLTNNYTNIYFHVRARMDSTGTPAGNRQFLKFSNGGSGTETNGELKVYFATNGLIRVVSGTGVNEATVNTYSTQTWYHVWGNYSSLGTGYVAFGTSSTFPSDPDAFVSYTGGGTNVVNTIWLTSPGVTTNLWDTIRVKIGSPVGDIDCD